MSELGTLRKLRASNSKLMKGNLALLMSIREVDSEIHEEWRELQQYCEVLEKRGLAIPPSCLQLMGNSPETNQSESEATMTNDDLESETATREHQQQTPQENSKRPGSRLSVQSVLNEEPSEMEGSDENESVSDQGSVDEQ